jgi:two-component system, chemotaxis family, chemotaxis protein CheY
VSDIIIVDDVRRVLRKVLEADGHSVTACSNGREALHAIAAHRPDLVITDVYMPEMDGIEFITLIREDHPDLPVVAVSGGSLASADFVLEDASQLGANAVLPKPYDVDEMRRTVSELLAGHGTAG